MKQIAIFFIALTAVCTLRAQDLNRSQQYLSNLEDSLIHAELLMLEQDSLNHAFQVFSNIIKQCETSGLDMYEDYGGDFTVSEILRIALYNRSLIYNSYGYEYLAFRDMSRCRNMSVDGNVYSNDIEKYRLCCDKIKVCDSYVDYCINSLNEIYEIYGEDYDKWSNTIKEYFYYYYSRYYICYELVEIYADRAQHYYESANIGIDKLERIEDCWLAYYCLLYDTTIRNGDQIVNDAIEYITKHLYSENVEYAYLLMACLINNEQYEKALDFYDSICSNFQTDLKLKEYQLMCYMYLGYQGEDVTAMAKCLSKVNKSASPLTTGFFLNAGEFRKGLDSIEYDKNIKWTASYLGFDSSDFYYYKAFSCYYGKDYTSAITYSNKSDTIANTDVLLLRGICYDKKADAEKRDKERDVFKRKAEKDYRNVVEIEKKRDTISSSPYAYAMMGQMDKAIETAQAMLARSSDSLELAENYYAMAEIYCLAGKNKAAKTCIKKSLEIEHDPMTLNMVNDAPFLSPIKKTVIRLVRKYSAENNVTMKVLKKEVADSTVIDYRPYRGDFQVVCEVNGIPVKMFFDTGAWGVLISDALAKQMEKNGTLTEDAFLGYGESVVADGRVVPEKIVRIRELKLGDIVMHDVQASIQEGGDDNMLLGQTVLSNFILEINPQEYSIKLKKIRYTR